MRLYEVSVLVIVMLIAFCFMWGGLYMAMPESDMTIEQSMAHKEYEQKLRQHHDDACIHKKRRET